MTGNANQSQMELDDLRAHKERLLREMKQTKGARFNAATRLEERDRSRTRLVAHASVAVIVVTILPSFLPVPSLVSGLIGLSTVAFSLAILAASLLQSSNADPVRAVKLHSCALEVNSLLRELRAEQSLDVETIKSYSARYDAVLMRHAVNHDQVDYERYKLEHPDEFPAMGPILQEATVKDVTKSAIAERAANAIAVYGLVLAGATFAAGLPIIRPLIEAVEKFLATLTQ
jgi:hypothetical protein